MPIYLAVIYQLQLGAMEQDNIVVAMWRKLGLTGFTSLL